MQTKTFRGKCPHCKQWQQIHICLTLEGQELDTETDCFFCKKDFYVNADTHKVSKKN